MELKDIDTLTELARLSMPEEEKERVFHDLGAILTYVEQIEEVVIHDDSAVYDQKNVMREDANPHEGGIYHDVLLGEAHESENGYLKVKQIL